LWRHDYEVMESRDVIGDVIIQLPLPLSYRLPIGKNPLSPTVFELFIHAVTSWRHNWRHDAKINYKQGH